MIIRRICSILILAGSLLIGVQAGAKCNSSLQESYQALTKVAKPSFINGRVWKLIKGGEEAGQFSVTNNGKSLVFKAKGYPALPAVFCVKSAGVIDGILFSPLGEIQVTLQKKNYNNGVITISSTYEKLSGEARVSK